MLKDALAMLALHLVARPWAETIAWTANLRAPRINLFVTGGSLEEAVTGRVFTEDVREPDRNFFYSQTTTPTRPNRAPPPWKSTARIPVAWICPILRPIRTTPGPRLPAGGRKLRRSSPPNRIATWHGSTSLDEDAVAANIDATEETNLLETRQFRFHCGCTLEKILPILGGWKDRLDDLFDDADAINLQCPRCAAKYRVTRDMIV